MTTIPIERAYSLQAAEAALMRELDALGYRCEFRIVGEFMHAATCAITDKKSGVLLAAGNGKGEPTASRVGSLFEATEHLFSHRDYLHDGKLTYFNSVDFCRHNAMCDTLPLLTLKSAEQATIPFLEYQAVHGVQRCFYPLALSCPSYLDALLKDPALKKGGQYPYARLEQYSSNSGTAIGMTSEEATIHGLLESIERTSLSKFLTKTFLLNTRDHLKAIDPRTLPPGISNVYSRLKKELGSNVFIFSMPNKFGIPAYCSWMEQHEIDTGIVGYGCSLSVEHAILRSLYELAQYFLLSKHIFGLGWLKTMSEAIAAQLAGFPLHQECAKFNLVQKCKDFGCESVNYQELATIPFSNHPAEYLAQLTDLIYANGETPFASELNILGNSITITHAFVTGEDRFFNVKNGKSTFPQSLE